MKIGYLLLWYKPFRKACIKELIKYAGKDIHYAYPRYLCAYFSRCKKPKFWMVCWTNIKECKLNKDSKFVKEIDCSEIQFENNQYRIKFLQECLKL